MTPFNSYPQSALTLEVVVPQLKYSFPPLSVHAPVPPLTARNVNAEALAGPAHPVLALVVVSLAARSP
jgi:hypothetical protein